MLIEVRKLNDNHITISNDTYGQVVCVGDVSVLPDIGVEYNYLQWSDAAWYEKYWVDLNNHIQSFTSEQVAYLQDLVVNWQQPLGQEGNPTLGQAQGFKKAELLNSFNDATKAIADVLPHEMTSWKDQEDEARAYVADNTTLTPVLDALVIARGLGETVAELANKVIANADAYRQAYYPLLGKYQSLTNQIALATTVADVEAIVW